MESLNQDSFEVENWEELFKNSLKTGRKKEFLKKIDEYILASNQIVKIKYDKHIRKRMAEIKAEDEKNKKKEPV